MEKPSPTLVAWFDGRWCDDCRVAHPAEIRFCFGCGGLLRPAKVTVDATGDDGKPTDPVKVYYPSRRVDWFGKSSVAGTCQCCQMAAPVYEGYTGGQALGVAACGPCRSDGHTHA